MYCRVVGHLCFYFVYTFSSLLLAKRLVWTMPVTIKGLLWLKLSSLSPWVFLELIGLLFFRFVFSLLIVVYVVLSVFYVLYMVVRKTRLSLWNIHIKIEFHLSITVAIMACITILLSYFNMTACYCTILFPLFLFIQDGLTALERASFSGHHKVVELLLRAGANPDLQDKVRMGVYSVKLGEYVISNNYICSYTNWSM